MNAFRFGGFLNWSTHVGRISGIPIRIHITILFFLLPAFSGRSLGLGFSLEYAVGIVLSIIIHELGHALTAKYFGMTGLTIMLHGFGGFAMSSGRRTPRQSLLITLAGPGATFLLAFACLGIGTFGLNASELGTTAFLQFFLLRYLGSVNLLLGFLNLVPVLPWDGGQALQSILAHRMPEFKAMRATAHLGLILAPVLLIYGYTSGLNFFGLFAIVGLITCYSNLAGSGGIRFGEVFEDRRAKKEIEEVKRREEAKMQDYLSDVHSREQNRAQQERLRKLLDDSDPKDR